VRGSGSRAGGAELTFQKMPACASHLGRYSGEIGLAGGQQSVTNLNATGQRGEDLLPSAQFCA
jgi:hypothetical protein